MDTINILKHTNNSPYIQHTAHGDVQGTRSRSLSNDTTYCVLNTKCLVFSLTLLPMLVGKPYMQVGSKQTKILMAK